MEEELLDTIENKVIMKDLDWYKDEIHCLYDEKKELQDRIDKAIEYIEKNINKQLDEDYLMNRTNLAQYNKTLLDILKGSDSND